MIYSIMDKFRLWQATLGWLCVPTQSVIWLTDRHMGFLRAKAIGIRWANENCLKWVIKNCTKFKAHKSTDYEDLDKDTHALG
jgi:hypothetical protein